MNCNINELLLIIGELTFTNRKLVSEIESLKRQLDELKKDTNNSV